MGKNKKVKKMKNDKAKMPDSKQKEKGEGSQESGCSSEPSTSGLALELAMKQFPNLNIKKRVMSGKLELMLRYKEVEEAPICTQCGKQGQKGSGLSTCLHHMVIIEKKPDTNATTATPKSD